MVVAVEVSTKGRTSYFPFWNFGSTYGLDAPSPY